MTVRSDGLCTFKLVGVEMKEFVKGFSYVMVKRTYRILEVWPLSS